MRFLTPLAVLLTALLLAACGSDDEPTDSPAADAPAKSAFPVTVQHKYGSTTIESEPKRVVAVGYTEQDAILALGVVPVGVGDFLGGYKWRERPWAQDALGGAKPAVVSGQEINFEAVAAQRPDLIIAINAGLQKDAYDKLSKIAPTVAQDGRYIDFGMPWEDQTLVVGKALGREEQAQKVIDDLHAKFAQVRKDHPEFEGKTAVMAWGGPDGYGAYASQDTRSRFLTDLGFKIPAKIDELAGKSFYVDFSQEQFRLLDQDVVVMYGSRKDVLANPVFKRLKAVKQDRIIYLDLPDQFAGAIGFSSVISLPYLIDESEDMFAAAVDGDAETPITQPE